MSNQYVGEIRPFGFTFAPRDWAFCDGQLMPISQNETLYAVIGTTYGGDGQSTFGLPDLRGRASMHQGTGPGLTTRVLGQAFGTSTVTLTSQQIPAHTHTIGALIAGASSQQTAAPTATSYLGESTPGAYHQEKNPQPTAPFSNKVISQQGGSLPHDNMQPFLVVNFCIALFGIFPTQN